MTRSEWVERVRRAYADDPCHVCGHYPVSIGVDEDGTVWAYCAWCNQDRAIAKERVPVSVDPEPDADDDLPF